jgi:dTDP-4-dehydrorhamnose reductase
MPDLSDAALDLLIDGESGVWHLANDGETSWGELAEWIAAEPECQLRFAPAAGSARNLVLTSEKAVMLPTLSDAIQRYLTGRPKPSSRTRAT